MRRQALTLLRTALRSGAGEASGANTTTAAASFALRRGFADDASLLKTPLYDFHVEHGGASSGPALEGLHSPPAQDHAPIPRPPA